MLISRAGIRAGSIEIVMIHTARCGKVSTRPQVAVMTYLIRVILHSTNIPSLFFSPIFPNFISCPKPGDSNSRRAIESARVAVLDYVRLGEKLGLRVDPEICSRLVQPNFSVRCQNIGKPTIGSAQDGGTTLKHFRTGRTESLYLLTASSRLLLTEFHTLRLMVRGL